MDHLVKSLESLKSKIDCKMSQVFPFSCIDDQMGLAFQGFYERDRGTLKSPDSYTNCKMHAQIQKPSAARFARGIAWTFTPSKFRSRISEAASANRCWSHATLLTPGPRRSEARPR
jgi:hypothetical protein